MVDHYCVAFCVAQRIHTLSFGWLAFLELFPSSTKTGYHDQGRLILLDMTLQNGSKGRKSLSSADIYVCMHVCFHFKVHFRHRQVQAKLSKPSTASMVITRNFSKEEVESQCGTFHSAYFSFYKTPVLVEL